MNDACKNLSQRASVIAGWRQDGGVLLMGYELYRQLANKKPRKKRQKKHEPVCIDIEEEDTNKTLLDGECEANSSIITFEPSLSSYLK